jgi:O-antigen ligase
MVTGRNEKSGDPLMSRMNTYRKIPSAAVLGRTSPFERPRSGTRSFPALFIIQYAYYAFIFTIPFESISFAGNYLSLSKITGLFFGLTTLLRLRLCFRRPPKAFWYFFAYLFVVMMMIPFQEPRFTTMIIVRLITMAQLLIIFWVSFNLMGEERFLKRALLTLIAGCTILAILMLLGVGNVQDPRWEDRDSALGTNPNTLSTILSLGLLALCGLAFGRQKSDLKALFLMAFCSGLLALEIVRTGSRGSIIAIIVSLMAFPLKKTKKFTSKLGLVLLGVLAVGFLVWASYSIKSVRERWESTFETGETAGRDRIFSNAWDMFLERPVLGWGPVTHRAELGSRLGLPFRDMHNLYLYVLTETGVLGSIPFFIGLWLCLLAAWKARNGFQGVLPLAMVACLLINNLKGTLIDNKLLWIVFAFALASQLYATRTKPPGGFPRANQPVRRRPTLDISMPR